MCVVSMIHDHYRHTTPKDFDIQQWPTGPVWDMPRWSEYQELLRKAREYDKLTGQPDCEDPKKAEFEKRVEDYLKKKGILK